MSLNLKISTVRWMDGWIVDKQSNNMTDKTKIGQRQMLIVPRF